MDKAERVGEDRTQNSPELDIPIIILPSAEPADDASREGNKDLNKTHSFADSRLGRSQQTQEQKLKHPPSLRRQSTTRVKHMLRHKSRLRSGRKHPQLDRPLGREELLGPAKPAGFLSAFTMKLSMRSEKDENWEKKNELRRAKTLRERELRTQSRSLREELDIGRDQLDLVGMLVKYIFLVSGTGLLVLLLYVAIQHLGDFRLLLWIIYEVLDHGLFISLGFLTTRMVLHTTANNKLEDVAGFRKFLIVVPIAHTLLLITGIGSMDYLVDLTTVTSQADSTRYYRAIAGICGIVYLGLNVCKYPLFWLWWIRYQLYYRLFQRYVEQYRNYSAEQHQFETQLSKL